MRWSFLVTPLLFISGQLAAGQDTYLYHRSAFSPEGDLQLDYVAAYGSREARPLGDQGIEQGVRAFYQAGDRVAVEVGTGALLGRDDSLPVSAYAEVHLGVLDQRKGLPLSLTTGLGYIYDYRGDHIPRLRLTLQRDQGPVDLNLSTLLEKPLADDRDELDIIVSLAGSVGIGEKVRVGGEIVGQDLEGFWEDEEAEGGAKLLAGPTARLELPNNFHLKANAAAVIPASNNFPTVVDESGATVANDPGVLARMMLGYTF